MAFLHASKSGYFPFCLAEATEGEYGAGTVRPFEMSLEDAMALYWKYKSFKVTGSITGSFSGEVEPDFFETYEFQINGTGALIDTGQPKMTDLVCNDIYSFTILIEEARSNGLYTIASPLFEDYATFNIYARGSIKKTPTPNSDQKLKIYPYIFLAQSAIIRSQTGFSATLFYVQPTENPDPANYSQTTISDGFQIKINGTTYKQLMYVYFSNKLSGSASGSLIIETGEERLAE
jgi:hypothetical protein